MEPYQVLDGGMATELTRQGYDFDDDPLWSARLLVDDTDAVKRVHYSFLECGSDIFTTVTYQASLSSFRKHLGITQEEAVELMQRGVRIATETLDDFWEKNSLKEEAKGRKKPLVAGAIGPYGACQHDGSEYSGNYVDTMSTEELMNWHRPQVKVLIDAGVDLLALETIPAQKEGEALVQLLKEFPNTKAWLSFCCKDEVHTAHGDVFSTAALSSMANSPQIVAVGVNCCSPIFVKPLLLSLQGKTNLPLIAYPNNGDEWVDARWQDRGKVAPFESYISEWLSVGARWIGGCCRTLLSDLSTIRTIMDTHRLR